VKKDSVYPMVTTRPPRMAPPSPAMKPLTE